MSDAEMEDGAAGGAGGAAAAPEQLVVPFVYGTIAFYQGKKASDVATHNWTVYVRGVDGNSLSPFVSSVVFTLHPSFENNVREVMEEPFAVAEKGDIQIQIRMRDQGERPVYLTHLLKLYPPGAGSQPSTKKPVVAETYDELIFTKPSAATLEYAREAPKPAAKLPFDDLLWRFDDKADLDAIAAAREHIQAKLVELRQEQHVVEGEIRTLRAEVTHLGGHVPPQ